MTLEMQSNNRLRIKLIVSLAPGVHLRKLQRHAGLSFNSTRYHVDKLTKAGEIVRVEEGGYSRLYPNGIGTEDRAIFALTHSDTDRKILRVLSKNGTLSSRQLVDLAHLAKSTVSEHLADLVSRGIVRIVESGESGGFFELTRPERVRTILMSQNPSLLKTATDRFIDLWDF